jgi:hypothetical protein
MSTSALSMDHTFWDTFPVEMGEFIDQVEILEQDRAILSGSQ